MLDRVDRLLIAAGSAVHEFLGWMQGRVFALVDDASNRVMRRRWAAMVKRRRR